VSRLEETVAHDNLQLSAVNPSNYRIRWDGTIRPDQPGEYQFGSLTLGAKVNVDGTEVAGPGLTSPISFGQGDSRSFFVELDPNASTVPYGLQYLTGAGGPLPVPRDWLRPDPAIPLHDAWGLAGDYRHVSDPAKNFGDETVRFRRLDQQVTLDTGDSPASGRVPENHFAAQWSGSITVPARGEYFLGGRHDRDMQVTVLPGDADQSVYAASSNDLSVLGAYDQSFAFEADQAVPIRVAYEDDLGRALAELWVQTPNGDRFKVPACWLTPPDNLSYLDVEQSKPTSLKIQGIDALSIDVSVSWDEGGTDTRTIGSESGDTWSIPADVTGVQFSATINGCSAGTCDTGTQKISWPYDGDECFDLRREPPANIEFDDSLEPDGIASC
jgi:hypothetical protein